MFVKMVAQLRISPQQSFEQDLVFFANAHLKTFRNIVHMKMTPYEGRWKNTWKKCFRESEVVKQFQIVEELWGVARTR